jgi:hypothetical protein
MDYVDRRAVTVRRGVDGDRVVLATGGAVGGAFTHGASRALDPHLHTHVVVANLAHGTDGRWSAVDGRGLRAHAPAAGALFDAHLRHELSRRLGVEWDPPSRTRREVIGLDPTVTAGFSLRRAEIRAQLGEWGATSPRASRVAWAVTRQAKASPEERSALAGRWSDRARRLGVTTEDLAAVVGRSLSELGGLDEHRFAATLWDSPHAAPTRRDVVRAWCRALPRGATVGEVEQSVDAWVPPAPELGVAESRQALRGLVPAGYLLRTLGPRPVAARDQQVWLDGARTVDRYRRTWGVTAREEPLGLPDGTAPLARLPARRLADHLAVQRTLDGVAQRLGRTPPSRVREHGRELGFDRG